MYCGVVENDRRKAKDTLVALRDILKRGGITIPRHLECQNVNSILSWRQNWNHREKMKEARSLHGVLLRNVKTSKVNGNSCRVCQEEELGIAT